MSSPMSFVCLLFVINNIDLHNLLSTEDAVTDFSLLTHLVRPHLQAFVLLNKFQCEKKSFLFLCPMYIAPDPDLAVSLVNPYTIHT